MCGIAGFYGTRVSDEHIQEVMLRLKHRGPDESQYWVHRDVGLIHTRLSIIELSPLGAQPYQYGSLHVIFNGEIYNYQEIRVELKRNGYSFQSNSDTEVLVKAFHCWREQCVSRLIGMFAFAIYDEEDDAIWLFRDRLGVKPLYYCFQNNQLIFASELKALSVLGHSKEIDPDSVYYYFRFGFIPGSRSIFKSVAKLEAGHYMKVSREGASIRKYWALAEEIDRTKTEEQWIDEMEELMISAFRYRMIADVPVGVFLSGGIDSSLLTAILQKHHGPIHSFTIGFKEKGFDESIYAREVAAHLKVHYTEKTLERSEAGNILRNFYDIYDEPFADSSGIPVLCVAKLAKEYGMKVVLSADGGDELFGGYTHYQRTRRMYNAFGRLPFAFRKALAQGSKRVLPQRLRSRMLSFNLEHKVYAVEELLLAENQTQFFEAVIANQSLAEISRLIRQPAPGRATGSADIHHPLQSMMAWDLNYYLADDLLVKIDRATMHHSIECREPFLDHRLVEFAMRIPVELRIKNGKGKYLVRKLLSRYVPERLFERQKQGFSIPIFDWFSNDLDGMFQTYFDPENLKSIDLLNTYEVEQEYKKYIYFKARGKQYNIEKMWRILSFLMWWEKYKKA